MHVAGLQDNSQKHVHIMISNSRQLPFLFSNHKAWQLDASIFVLKQYHWGLILLLLYLAGCLLSPLEPASTDPKNEPLMYNLKP